MQWRVVLAGVIIAALLVGGFLSCNHIRNICREVSLILDQSLSDFDPADPAAATDEAAVLQAQALWDAHETYFSIMLPHDHLDQVNLAFQRALGFCKMKNREEYYSSLKELLRLIEIIAEFDQLNLRNIL